MKFHEALQRTITDDPGIGIYRSSWPGCADRAKGIPQFVATAKDAPVHKEVDHTFQPFLFIQDASGWTPWTPTQADLFADDWEALWP